MFVAVYTWGSPAKRGRNYVKSMTAFLSYPRLYHSIRRRSNPYKEKFCCSLPGARGEGIAYRRSSPGVKILDTTLRDGLLSSQAPKLTVDDKVYLASQLQKLKVDILEVGTVGLNRDEDEAVLKAISTSFAKSEQRDKHQHAPVICALCAPTEMALRAAADALRDAPRPRLHSYVRTSAPGAERLAGAVAKFARLFCDDVQITAADATRSSAEDVRAVLANAAFHGATTVSVADTAGKALPSEFKQLITDVRNDVAGDVVVSVHAHNDFGLAVANSLAGLEGGARQIECTINGVGARAGNAALEQVVSVLNSRGDYFFHFFPKVDTYHLPFTGIDPVCLSETSHLVSRIFGNSSHHLAESHDHSTNIHMRETDQNSKVDKILYYDEDVLK